MLSGLLVLVGAYYLDSHFESLSRLENTTKKSLSIIISIVLLMSDMYTLQPQKSRWCGTPLLFFLLSMSTSNSNFKDKICIKPINMIGLYWYSFAGENPI